MKSGGWGKQGIELLITASHITASNISYKEAEIFLTLYDIKKLTLKRGLTEHDGPHIVNEGKDEIIGEKRQDLHRLHKKCQKKCSLGERGQERKGNVPSWTVVMC